MIQNNFPITFVSEVVSGIFVTRFRAPEIARAVKPGQFINIRVHNQTDPLLRRPFSVRRVVDDDVEIIFNIVGRGTSILATKKVGEYLDVIGPLGNPFTIDNIDGEVILLAGGMGVAPLPILTEDLIKANIKLKTFIGARTSDGLILDYLLHTHVATEDGSRDYKGTVIELLKDYLEDIKILPKKIFACGPNQMLKSLSKLLENYNIQCEVSLESVMACGFGICQGCPVELSTGGKKFGLVCTDGPVFNIKSIKMK